jgi:uncharacterized protein YkwD
MRFFFTFLFFYSPFFTFSQSQRTIKDTIYKEVDGHIFLKNIKFDSLLQLERMTSFHFHQLLNQYRISKGKKTIYWDDKLWLAARNHNIYLLRNNKNLNHNESSSKAYFSGNLPQNRVDYVTYSSGEFKFGGFENCAVSGEMIPSSIDEQAHRQGSINDLVVLAKSSAENMFELWKSSPGHNSNMLDSEHLAHGTSVIFGEFAEYGTSVFTQKQKYYSPDTIDLNFNSDLLQKFDLLYKENGNSFEPYPDEFNRIEFKMFKSMTENMNSYSIIPNRRLYELIKTEKSNLQTNFSPKKRYLKQTNYLGIFKFGRYKLIRIDESFYISALEFTKLAGMEKIKEILQSNSDYLFSANSWAGTVEAINEGDKIKVNLILYVFTPKKK